ncbi:hypothetical protein BDN72DRAFT_851586 [Pluteus cervinus]|uniref:Uncharacterized protein n=1 Tax=Pluteus cervinus TaxID=181527 RepID=A0ACD2ZZE8_9AGAR|nr:hypothetical protein BDN72DRAFT_851586 [Pluteus cervinus]
MLSRILPDSISRYFVAAEQHTDPAPSQEDHHSPIQSLPPELLQEIFAFSASPFPDPRPVSMKMPRRMRFQTNSLCISRVCRQWRYLSFATPEMWSWMIISSPDELCVKLVQYYLRRAGRTQPLHLSLTEYPWPSSPEAENQFTLAIFALWIPEAHRWKRIEFEFHHTPPILDLINLSPSSLGGVTSVSLRTRWPEETTQLFWDILHTSPALREVQWPVQLLRDPNSASVAQLTFICAPHLDLSWTEFFSLLSCCTRLRDIEVGVASITEAEARSTTRTILVPSLETLLLVSDSSGIGACHLLDYTRAPNLRELKMYVSQRDPTVLRRFIFESGCVLRKLTLKGTNSMRSEEGVLLDFLLQASPYLTSLEVCMLHHDLLSCRTICALSPQIVDGAISILLPSVISLIILVIDSVPEGVIGDMLLRRAQHGALPWIFEVHFARDNKIQAWDKEITSQLQKYGLRASYY